jgi:hypothetical protein
VNLFPSIGAQERKKYLKFGRERAEGRMQRQQKQITNHMCKEQQWIPLTGPGGRLPTADDIDDEGQVYFLSNRVAERDHFERTGARTHFCPIPKSPPLPKPVEITQEQKDLDIACKMFADGHTKYGGLIETIKAGIRYGRSDGRAQLAREALGLFDGLHIPSVCLHLKEQSWTNLPAAIDRIHALLTKAAEAKP